MPRDITAEKPDGRCSIPEDHAGMAEGVGHIALAVGLDIVPDVGYPVVVILLACFTAGVDADNRSVAGPQPCSDSLTDGSTAFGVGHFFAGQNVVGSRHHDFVFHNNTPLNQSYPDSARSHCLKPKNKPGYALGDRSHKAGRAAA